ncbi:RNA polymerase, sigma-24 subunit, ECF subfamily [Verrucomicrobia bacterium]|nr:RNA polymerase, sigma-24 subunit, ECF subfamily [Verrucomicrobiota bacterium]
MNESLPDKDLLRDFIEHRSETAFQALSERHADLVFATALRRVGEASAAQEVTQDVFVALARKAPWLKGETSLTGWLYKAALFQARRWWRGEMRRRRREQAAMELNTTMKDDNSLLNSLGGVLDEGLLELRESERRALLLRFFEGGSYRQIGATLGIGEDAARKRVDKAVAQLTAFFKKRGYAVGSVAATAAALNAAAVTAPAGLAAQAAQVALAQTGAGSFAWLTGWLARLLRPSKVQAVALCTALLVGPGLWQGARWLSAAEEQTRMQAMLASMQAQRKAVAQEQAQVQRQLRRTSNWLAQLNVLAGYTKVLTEANLDPRLFRWDESAGYVRVPKVVMRWLSFDTGTLGGNRTLYSQGDRLSPILLGALGLNADEQARVQQFCQNQMDAYRSSAESRSYLTNLPPLDVVTNAFTPDTQAWFTPALSSEESSLWRERFQAGLASLIGDERTGLILANAKDDGSLSTCFHGFGSEMDLIAVTPSPEGRCELGKLHYSQVGLPLGMAVPVGGIPLSWAMNRLSEPSAPPQPEFPVWEMLGRQPLPAALVDYLRQWAAVHPEVPDQAPTTP